MAEVRSFIALDVGCVFCEQVRPLISELGGIGRTIRTVGPETMHLTLKFLGDVEEERLKGPIFDALARSLSGWSPFPVQFHGCGAFPSEHHPRVLWVGVGQGGETVKKLHAAVEGTLVEKGFDKEDHDFIPHVTVGRVKRRTNLRQVRGVLERYRDCDFGRTTVRGVTIMKSALRPSGPVYTPLEIVDL